MCSQSADQETRDAANEALEELYAAREEEEEDTDDPVSDDSDYD